MKTCSSSLLFICVFATTFLKSPPKRIRPDEKADDVPVKAAAEKRARDPETADESSRAREAPAGSGAGSGVEAGETAVIELETLVDVSRIEGGRVIKQGNVLFMVSNGDPHPWRHRPEMVDDYGRGKAAPYVPWKELKCLNFSSLDRSDFKSLPLRKREDGSYVLATWFFVNTYDVFLVKTPEGILDNYINPSETKALDAWAEIDAGRAVLILPAT